MRCEICGDPDPNPILVLPIRQPDGCINTIACQDCALKSSAFCHEHNQIHLGFEDSTTACAVCIESLIAINIHRAATIRTRIRADIGQDDIRRLEEYESLFEPMRFLPEEVVLRALASYACRVKLPLDNVIEMVLNAHSPAVILPRYYQ